ncbi:hypothetical protein FSO04_21840 [Paraburkholderia madseniana]|jgi:hypothetical protein|uniref:Uncharacterized protein n=1 Tax=Paraburkholderia madseniana TaxID=2599607 RepID=A0A6N6WB09_9BURK|nr:hypothetical protein [Paraburkholderia madseniana]KAE8757845.1 hypothetical protein FSO04_21840 [Paraburkholderia madseniana]
MQTSQMVKQATPEQQARALQAVELGIRWIAGKTSFDEIKQQLGSPKRTWRFDFKKESGFAYYSDIATLKFTLAEDYPSDKEASALSFQLEFNDGVSTRIRKEDYETRLGLHRLVEGESIDGTRTESLRYFNPWVIDPTSSPDGVTFAYRLPMPVDSPYDVYVNVDYEAKFEHDGPEFASLQSPVDLRRIEVRRSYLTLQELEQRRLAKRQKYGMMNLCTGMLCPETGLWEGWSENGATDKSFIRAGARFDEVSLHTWEPGVREQWVNGKWIWLGP